MRNRRLFILSLIVSSVVSCGIPKKNADGRVLKTNDKSASSNVKVTPSGTTQKPDAGSNENTPPPLGCNGLAHGAENRRMMYKEANATLGQLCTGVTQTQSCNNGVVTPWAPATTFSAVSCSEYKCNEGKTCNSDISNSTSTICLKDSFVNLGGDVSSFYYACEVLQCKAGFKKVLRECVPESETYKLTIFGDSSFRCENGDWRTGLAPRSYYLKGQETCGCNDRPDRVWTGCTWYFRKGQKQDVFISGKTGILFPNSGKPASFQYAECGPSGKPYNERFSFSEIKVTMDKDKTCVAWYKLD